MPDWCSSGCPFHYSSCFVEKPIHAVQRLEEAFRRLNWQGRAILGDCVCSICRSCHHLMAFSCHWSCYSCSYLQLLPGTIQWHSCSPGLPEVSFLIICWVWIIILKSIEMRTVPFSVGMKFNLKRCINFQEDSLLMGLSYIVAVISLFDEYVNDLLYLREGSCLPRYIYGLVYFIFPSRHNSLMGE